MSSMVCQIVGQGNVCCSSDLRAFSFLSGLRFPSLLYLDNVSRISRDRGSSVGPLSRALYIVGHPGRMHARLIFVLVQRT